MASQRNGTFTRPGDGFKAAIRMNNGMEEVDLDGLLLYIIMI